MASRIEKSLFACNPIMVHVDGATPGQKYTLTLREESFEDVVHPLLSTINLTVYADKDGVIRYDISPVVASRIRLLFNGGYDPLKAFLNVVENGKNTYHVFVNLFGAVEDLDEDVIILFGSVNKPYEDNDYNFYNNGVLLRKSSIIHYYPGLPCSVGTWGRGDMVLQGQNTTDKLITVGNHTNISAIGYNYNNDKDLNPGEYRLYRTTGSEASAKWIDSSAWNDLLIWDEHIYTPSGNAVYRLVVHEPISEDCLRYRRKLYLRYWNSLGAWSYALLDVKQEETKAKTESVNRVAYDMYTVNGRVQGDRVLTEKNINVKYKAGKDMCNAQEIAELQDLQRSYCVQMYDVDNKAFIDVYVDDSTTTSISSNAQEFSCIIELSNEFTQTR